MERPTRQQRLSLPDRDGRSGTARHPRLLELDEPNTPNALDTPDVPDLEERYLRGRPVARHGLPRHTEPEPVDQPRPARVATFIGLSTAFVLLCAAIAVAAVINQDRHLPEFTRPPTWNDEITGVRALDPRFAAGYAPVPASSAVSAPVQPSGAATTSKRAGVPSYRRQAEPSTTSATAESRVLIESAATDEEVRSFVRTFYRLLDSNPPDALQLVHPRLVAKQRERLVRSWETMENVTVGTIEPAGPNTVIAEVSMHAEGSVLRLSQQLRVSGPRNPLVKDVRVLSAQRG
ncbi:MAG: hypothetical protein GEU98_28750 [Pseudonocardiaceae bacterium]|nr:hypothetical protein [Pseudonocardiaceae bacterium]